MHFPHCACESRRHAMQTCLERIENDLFEPKLISSLSLASLISFSLALFLLLSSSVLLKYSCMRFPPIVSFADCVWWSASKLPNSVGMKWKWKAGVILSVILSVMRITRKCNNILSVIFNNQIEALKVFKHCFRVLKREFVLSHYNSSAFRPVEIFWLSLKFVQSRLKRK